VTRQYSSVLRDQQAAATRERIVAACVELMVAEPTAYLSMPRVAEEAGVAVRTVYRHFANRDELIAAVHRRVEAGLGLTDQDDPTTPEELTAVMRAVARGALADEPFQRAKHYAPENRVVDREAAEKRLAWLQRAVAGAVEGADEWEVRRLVAMLRLVCTSKAFFHLVDVGGVDADEAQDAMVWAIETLVDATRPGTDSPAGGSPRGGRGAQ